MNWKLWGSTIIAGLLAVTLIVLALLVGDSPTSHYMNIALLVLGALCWVARGNCSLALLQEGRRRILELHEGSYSLCSRIRRSQDR